MKLSNIVLSVVSLCVLITIAVVFLGNASTTKALAKADHPKPSFVIVVADDLGWGDLGSFGHERIQTPNLDRLATSSLRLTNLYAAAPLCTPSRAGLLTGQTPYRLAYNDIHLQGDPTVYGLPLGTATIADLLQQDGYDTSIFGKWHVGGNPADHGFDYWMVTEKNAAPDHLNVRNFVRNGVPVGSVEGPSSHYVVDQALSWLANRDDPDRPFLLLIWLHEPHEPIAVSKKFLEQYEGLPLREQYYYGNVSQMDDAVGNLINGLKESGVWEKNFFLFTSDNGPEYRAPTSAGSTGQLRGKKLSVYEGGVRVPGILHWPSQGRKPELNGTSIDTPLAATDLYATICHLAGLRCQESLDGENWAELLVDGRSRSKPIYWRERRNGRAAMRIGDLKVLGPTAIIGFEVYDLGRDPSESVNLIGSPQAAHATELYQQFHNEVTEDYRNISSSQIRRKHDTHLPGSQTVRKIEERPQILDVVAGR